MHFYFHSNVFNRRIWLLCLFYSRFSNLKQNLSQMFQFLLLNEKLFLIEYFIWTLYWLKIHLIFRLDKLSKWLSKLWLKINHTTVASNYIFLTIAISTMLRLIFSPKFCIKKKKWQIFSPLNYCCFNFIILMLFCCF